MIDVLSLILGLAGGAVVAALIVWLAVKGRAAGRISAIEARLDEQATARSVAEQALAVERSARSSAEQAVARHQTEALGERKNLDEQRRLLDDARTQLSNVFRAVGSEELVRMQKELVERSASQHAEQQKLAVAELEQRRQAIDASLKPIEQLLVQQRTAIGELERNRVAAYSSIETQIKGMLSATDSIRVEAGKLTTAMKRSDARGRWGEVALRNLVEMSGMTEHVDFETQKHVIGDDGAHRPDLVVRLPGGGSVVVDAKVPLEHYLAAQEADADVPLRMVEHAKAVRGHVDALSAKAYWNQFDMAPSYVVMFMPIESALAAAFVARPDLQEYALRSRVILASSGIFLALLQTVSLFWRQEQLAENAREISDAGLKLYDRLAVFASHFNKLGDALGNVNKHYNSAVGSFESRLLSSAKELRDLKVTSAAELTSPTVIEVVPRRLESDELAKSDD